MVDQLREKMSKVRESISPLELVNDYGADAFRFFVMREMKVGHDAEFSLERFESRYRADLGNDLGNLLSRLLHMCSNYFDSVVPQNYETEQPEIELQEKWKVTHKISLEFLRSFNLV